MIIYLDKVLCFYMYNMCFPSYTSLLEVERVVYLGVPQSTCSRQTNVPPCSRYTDT